MNTPIKELVKTAWSTLKTNYAELMRYVGLSFALMLIFGFLIVLLFGITFGAAFFLKEDGMGSSSGAAMIIAPLVAIILSIIMLVLNFWLQIASLRTAKRALHNEPKAPVKQEFVESKPMLAKSIGIVILTSIITTTPFFIGILSLLGFSVGSFMVASGNSDFPFSKSIPFLLIGGVIGLYGFFHLIYFSIRFFFSYLAVALDGKGVMESLKYSSSLVKGRWFTMFLKIVGLFLAFQLPYLLLSILSTPYSEEMIPIQMFFALLAYGYYLLVLLPIGPILLVLLYEEAKKTLSETTPSQIQEAGTTPPQASL